MKTSNEIQEIQNNRVSKKKILLYILSYVIAGLFFMFGILAVIPGCTFLNVKPDDAIQWFIFSMIVLLIPYVNEISFKGLSVKLSEYKEVKKDLENLSINGKVMMNNVDQSRKELVHF